MHAILLLICYLLTIWEGKERTPHERSHASVIPHPQVVSKRQRKFPTLP